jgi:hypothetical protein
VALDHKHLVSALDDCVSPWSVPFRDPYEHALTCRGQVNSETHMAVRWVRLSAASGRSYSASSRHLSQADCLLTPKALATSAHDWPRFLAVVTAFRSAVSRRARINRMSSSAFNAACPSPGWPGDAEGEGWCQPLSRAQARRPSCHGDLLGMPSG